MNGISLKKKLILAFGTLMVVMALLGAYAIIALQSVNEKTTDITKSCLPSIIANNKMLDASNAYRLALLRQALAADPAAKAKFEADVTKADEIMQNGIKEYEALTNTAIYSSEEARQKDLEDAKKVSTLWSEAYKLGNKSIALSRANKGEEAFIVLDTEISPALTKLEKDMILPMKAYNEELANRSSKEAADIYTKAIWILAAVIVVCILIGLSIMTALTKNIMSSIDELMRIFKEVSAGNLRDRAVVQSQDEFGLLIDSYNKLLDSTGGLIHKIQGTSEQVAAASEELTASAEQSAEVTQQIAASITQVSELSSNEVNAINTANGVIEQISAGIEESAAGVKLAAENTKRAVETARQGRESIDGAVDQMNNIEKTVNRSANVVTKLGERSKEIGQIVDTISGIAGQTNLLALNAAIEAARAGEQGKGFAVVAEEVRKLAEQSQEAAKQIGELISGIQVDTDEAVVAMSDGTKEVRTGAEVVNKAGSAFVEILKMVDEVNQQAVDMAEIMEELANGTQKIVDSVQQIDVSSKNVAGEAQTVSAATEEQSAAMQEIASSSRGLSNLAQQLQEASSKFKF